MEASIHRRQTAFRLNTQLLEDLKVRASKCNRSLNNYVESLLMQVLYSEDTPNETTQEAIRETLAGKYAGTLNLTDFDSFIDSIDATK